MSSILEALMADSLAVVILLLIVGLALVLIGAEVLVDGSSTIARKSGMSEFVIGLSIVALGTSAPEMVVSFVGAIQGNADISVGNILGSNIFNTAFVLGLSALIAPVLVTRTNRRRDLPMNLICTLMLFFMGMNATVFHKGEDLISRIDGIIFLLVFLVYMFVAFKFPDPESAEEETPKSKDKPIWMAIIFILGGILALVFGGEIFVSSAESIAKKAGLSDKFIAVTILACGTSLPELATSIVAAAKGRGQMALGNVLGSNACNILLVVGGSALINPLSMSGINLIDFAALGATALIPLLAIAVSRKKVSRLEGGVLLAVGIVYMTYLILAI